MPGIFGVVDTSGRAAYHDGELVEIVESMAAAMRYEPRYSSEVFRCAELGACVARVGWPTSDGPQGAGRAGADLILVTAGEPAGTRAPDRWRAAPGGVEWSGVGALDVAWAYSQAGEDALTRLKGAFAGFVMDRQGGRCLLFNDRYGIERLFLHRDGARTYFSSEAKAILAVAPRTRAFDPQGLAQFLACGCTLGSRSLFAGIEILPGGTVVSFPAGAESRRRAYFDRATLEKSSAVPEETFLTGVCASLKSAVTDAVERGPRTGVSLTGGLDSRMIMACLDAAPGDVPCYTFGSMYRETLDVSIGRQVAAHCRQPHAVLELGRDFLRGFATTLDQAVLISDGYLGVSGAAELHVNRAARTIAPVRMTGNWGGELLRGVRAFKYLQPTGAFLSDELMQHLRRSAEEFASMGDVKALSFTLFHQAPSQGYGRYAVERSQVVMRSPFLDNDVVQWLYRAPGPSATADARSAAIIERQRPDLLAIPTDQGQLGSGGRVVRSARHLYRRGLAKAEYLTNHGAPHWLAGATASGAGSLVERAFRGRNKFQHFHLWFRRELADVVRGTLLDAKQWNLQAWFDMPTVERMVEDHLHGRANYTEEIDRLLTVAVASRRLLTAGAVPARAALAIRS